MTRSLRQPRIAIIGAGMSGMCLLWSLKQAGFHDIAVFEKGDEVGGTWRENTYPGLACDVPSRFYQFTFAPNPDWSHVFSSGTEIQEYFVRTADELGLRPYMRFGSEVSDLAHTEGSWQLTTADGAIERFDFVVSATGLLHHPAIPALPGLESFTGPWFHSARWNHDAPTSGRRVGIVGSGSTGVQIVSALAGSAAETVLFQRSPHWILTVGNPSYPAIVRSLHRRMPWLGMLGYHGYRFVFEFGSRALTEPGWRRRAAELRIRASVRAVADPGLRAVLTPDDAPMCRRLILSPEFFAAVQRPDVRVVPGAIDRVTATGVIVDGVHYELDVLVLATGFDAQAFIRPTTVTGPERTLQEAWQNGPVAYHGVAAPGLPNLFFMMGPHSPVGNYALTAVAEAQAGHITRWIRRWACEEFDLIEPTDAATDRFNGEMRRALPDTVWASGCTSWYLGADGTPALWPWTPQQYRRILARPREADWSLSRRVSAGSRRSDQKA